MAAIPSKNNIYLSIMDNNIPAGFQRILKPKMVTFTNLNLTNIIRFCA
jgi:hypothetical protein